MPDEVKAKAMADLQGLPQLAADAQHKMPKMFMVAVERATNPTINAASNDDANLLVNVIQFVSLSTLDADISTRRFRSLRVKRLKTNTWLRRPILVCCAIASLRF